MGRMRQNPLDRRYAEVSESGIHNQPLKVFIFSIPTNPSSVFLSSAPEFQVLFVSCQSHSLFIHSFSSKHIHSLPLFRHSFNMGLRSTYASSMLALASVAAAQNCPLAFDGRVPAGSTPALFDTEASPFGTGFVKGANLTFSQLIKIPDVPASLVSHSNSWLEELDFDTINSLTPQVTPLPTK